MSKNKEVWEGVKKIHSGIKEVLAELGDSNLPLANILNEAVWALNKQFPELAESEDERIRRTLVEYFGPSAQLDFIRGVPIQKIRDWLERQKEQSTEHKTYDGKALSRSYDLGYSRGVADAEKEMYDESGYTPDESRAYDHGYENGYNDGKDEAKQKPAEWSEEE